MRISENMKASGLIYDLNRAMGKIIKTQEDLADSKRIHRPSDDPGGTLRVMRWKTELGKLDQYESNIDDGTSWMTTTESALNDTVDIFTDVNSVLLQASNDTLDDGARQTLATQIQQIWNQTLSTANQKFGDKYIFGGTQNRQAPYTASNTVEDETFTSQFDEAVLLDNVDLSQGSVRVTSADGLVTYTEGTDYTVDLENGIVTVLSSGGMADGTDFLISYETEKSILINVNPEGISGDMTREINDGMTTSINVSGEDVFGSQGELFDALKSAYNALVRNDMDVMRQIRASLEGDLDRISGIQGEVGTKIDWFLMEQEQITADRAQIEKLMSSVLDTDITKATLDLQKDQVVYEAALKTGANLVQMSLLDYF